MAGFEGHRAWDCGAFLGGYCGNEAFILYAVEAIRGLHTERPALTLVVVWLPCGRIEVADH